MFRYGLSFLVGVAIVAGMCTMAGSAADEPLSAGRLALLVAVPDPGKWSEAAGNDQALFYQALRDKGFQPGQMVLVKGPVSRTLFLDCLREAARRIAGWKQGTVILHYTGSGCFVSPDNGGPDKPGVELAGGPEDTLLWQDIITTLRLPPGVQLTILPDCCYNNMLVGQIPPQVTALVMKTRPGERRCRADNHPLEHAGKRTPFGIITFFAAHALRDADTMEQWQKRTSTLIDKAVAEGQLPEGKHLQFAVAGDLEYKVVGRSSLEK